MCVCAYRTNWGGGCLQAITGGGGRCLQALTRGVGGGGVPKGTN